jgi:hypothetical protein
MSKEFSSFSTALNSKILSKLDISISKNDDKNNIQIDDNTNNTNEKKEDLIDFELTKFINKVDNTKGSLKFFVHLQNDYFLSYEDEKAIITCLLHDVCKIGTYKVGFRNVKNEQTGQWEKVQVYENVDTEFPFGHGEKSVFMISQFIKLTKEEILMIRWHMGAYESKECWRELGIAQEMYPSVLYIHFADMLATKVRGV